MDNDQLAELAPLTRLLFIYLWMLADREGRLEDRPKRIRAQAFPYDDLDCDVALADLQAGGFLRRYEVDGEKVIQITSFLKHQMPHHKEAASTLPPPPGQPAVTRHPYAVTATRREAIFERDGRACLRCQATVDLSLDHVVPLASGGNNEDSNLQTLCKRCNSAKGDTTKDYRKPNVKPTLNQHQTNVDQSLVPVATLIPDSLIPDSLIPDKEAAPSGPAPLPAERKKPAVLLRTWLEQCRLAGEKAISDYEPIKVYVEKSSLPWEFVQLCWDEFRRRHMPGGGSEMKRQADWRKTFLNCLQGNWYRLWWARAEGEYELTSSGLQAKTVNRVPEAA